jgi:hypothetical protein
LLLWADGFDHYGTDLDNMTDGVYATAHGISLSTTHPATGAYGIYISTANDIANGNSLRKVLPAPADKIGVMGRFYFAGLPSGNIGGNIFDFLTSSADQSHVVCVVDSSGAIRFLRGRNYVTLNGENGTLIAQTGPVITANGQHHIEVQIYIHDSAGWIRVAVDGVHKNLFTGLDTKNGSSTISSISQAVGISGGSGSKDFYMDDYIIYDFTGNPATDTDFCPTVDGSGIGTNYIGELQCVKLQPNGNTASDAWGKSTGASAFALVDEATPDDTDYIYSTTAGDLTVLSLEDLPPEITYIRGLVVWGRLSKADSGSSATQFGMKSVAASTDAAARPVTVEPTYYWDFINVDPNSSARWTRTSLNAAWFRMTRSA